jgi:pimeloyl-ACP methyl ester carboxylesterase
MKLSDTVSLRYQKSGNGPPLILLHTIRTQLEYFRALAPLLAEKFTVYAVDMPGHGFSSVDTTQTYDEPYLRSGIVEFLKRLDLRDVTMVGESIGAVVALTVASEIPERIKVVFALKSADYETRYGDGIRRGNWFANLIIGSPVNPVFGTVAPPWPARRSSEKIMAGMPRDPAQMPADLIAIFADSGRLEIFTTPREGGVGRVALLHRARERYAKVEAGNASFRATRIGRAFRSALAPRKLLKNSFLHARERWPFLFVEKRAGSGTNHPGVEFQDRTQTARLVRFRSRPAVRWTEARLFSSVSL